jgi:hypothetical protein
MIRCHDVCVCVWGGGGDVRTDVPAGTRAAGTALRCTIPAAIAFQSSLAGVLGGSLSKTLEGATSDTSGSKSTRRCRRTLSHCFDTCARPSRCAAVLYRVMRHAPLAYPPLLEDNCLSSRFLSFFPSFISYDQPRVRADCVSFVRIPLSVARSCPALAGTLLAWPWPGRWLLAAGCWLRQDRAQPPMLERAQAAGDRTGWGFAQQQEDPVR